MFDVGKTVHVPSAEYSGTIMDVRINGDQSRDCLVRYSVSDARRDFYETWWPEGYLEEVHA